jgi:Domain of unknown function (DUF4835)
MIRSILLFGVIFFLKCQFAAGGELSCNVQINTTSIEATNKQIFESMRKSISDFLNNTKWTDDEFAISEKIECNVYITITDNSSVNKFGGSIEFQSARPVFSSSYNTPLFTHLDKEFNFEYIEFQAIELSEGNFTSNLASVLAYYANLVIGFDYDSFSKLGGTKYFQKAQEIVNQAQGKDYSGWDAMSTSKNNRYWLVNQLLNNVFQPLREMIYSYHRLGLDIMYEKQEEGRNIINESLKNLFKVNKDEPNSYLMQVFFDTKRDEISKIFSNASPTEIEDIKLIANDLDAANSMKYFEKK